MTGETGWPITQHAGGIAGAVWPGRQAGDAVRETRPVRDILATGGCGFSSVTLPFLVPAFTAASTSVLIDARSA
jgi:hypothetical protein